MIKYKMSGGLKIEMVEEGNYSLGSRITYIYPIDFSGLGYSFEQLLKKKNELQNVIKEFMDRSTN